MKILDSVFTSSEAAVLWGLDGSTVKKACQSGSMYCKKSSRSWLVTEDSMNERFGSILERIVKGKHSDPVNGLLRLYELNTIDLTDIKFKLTLSPTIRKLVLEKIWELEECNNG